MTLSSFSVLGLSGTLLRALADADYQTMTPIQAAAIPPLLQGNDLLGIAQTGTGKTAAFLLPVIEALSRDRRHPVPRTTRALILVPTRELALQIADSVRTYGRYSSLRHAVIMGGVSQRPQVKDLEKGTDILIATPGRLIDLVQQNQIVLSRVSHLVLDEADRMLDLGFIRDVRKLTSLLPKRRQSMLFSATMPSDIARLAQEILNDPVHVEIAAKTVAVDRIDQKLHYTPKTEKLRLLANLLADPAMTRVVVFTRTKRGADRVFRQLATAGIGVEAIHGNKAQGARKRALDGFREGSTRVLVATDIVSRGIDVEDISHVVNYDLPDDPESYIHRIGRTARAGRSGVAISFCDSNERGQLRDIERLINRRLTVVGEREPIDSVSETKTHSPKSVRRAKPRSRGRNKRRDARQAA